MRIDLHSHTTCSDGTDTPAAMVAAAAAAGLDVIAITDHDTTAGWGDALEAGEHHGIRVIVGIELSTDNLGTGAHLLAYEPDPTSPALADLIEHGARSRANRVADILTGLASVGIHLTEDGVAQHAGGGTTGKPHVADALVAAGYVASRGEAFSTLLRRGMPGHAARWQPTIEDAISAVRAAGGVPVLAHPRSRGARTDAERIADLAALGLAGLEVDHQLHDAATRADLRGLATELALIATGSSDYHGAGKVNHDLGCNTTSPHELDRLLHCLLQRH